MDIKKVMYTLFVAFLSSVATIGILSVLATEPPQSAAEMGRAISLEDVGKHNTAADCWMVIAGIVYDFTEYIPKHPTPPQVITDWCGKEATEAFNTKGYGRPHSPAAHELLPRYRIGKLPEE
jgi:cytochrome b involved in lipid metabolism